MRLDDRDHIIAVAEAHLRGAGVGVSELLWAKYVSLHERLQSMEEQMRSRGNADAMIQQARKYLTEHPPRPEWHVGFLLRDPRYVDGITAATVKIDVATGTVGLEIFQRSPPAVA